MKAVCMMTGALIALSAGLPQAAPVQAPVSQEAREIQVKKPEDFINAFLTEKIIGKDGKETTRQIESVSETNYAQVLEGRSFLEKADPELKTSIESELEKRKIDWKTWCSQAEDLKKKQDPEKEPEKETDPSGQAGSTETAGTAAGMPSPETGKPVKPGQPDPGGQSQSGTSQEGTQTAGSQAGQSPASGNSEKPAEGSQGKPGSSLQTSGQDNQKPTEGTGGTGSSIQDGTQETPGQNQPADKTPTLDKESGEKDRETTEKPAGSQTDDAGSQTDAGSQADKGSQTSTVDAGTSVEAEKTGDSSQPSAPADSNQTSGVQTSQQPAASADPEAGLQPAEAARQNTVQQNVQAQPSATGGPLMNTAGQSNAQPAVLSDEAAAFIASWLTSAQGNLYAAATSQNQARILEAMPAWNSLSPAARKAVNDRLRAVNGKTFQKLVREAQQLRLGKPLVWNNTRVHTAARDETGFFTGLLVASAAMAAALADRLRKDGKKQQN